MVNKVKWKREESGSAIPYMFEEIKSNHWGWIKYTNSKVHVPDKGNAFSRGYLSFLNALKVGYVVEHLD